MKKLNKFLLLGISVCLLSSCTRDISSDVYSVRQVGEASITYMGKIRSVRAVTVNQNAQLDENGLGIAGGGVTGGIIGNAAGRGHLLPTAFGAVAGAVAGSLIEKRAKQQAGLEYAVELDNGDLLTVVQGPNDNFYIGQPVYVIVSASGRSRITPQ
ncbi:peptidoglycan-associated lipoprotein (pal) [Candidatus Protochlamydia amoebophila]|uniref:Glycine zipper 2TM domain-containing protein n=1 Tax=Protochlamydia amoebophila (strain UWE25) TaxID=264201 RepID=Q6MDL9_PARUW|nr:peptidoglycan-associated lipoprotein (pal) [Candidatus Protochlamydia amoebophila]CAF23330.1 unnamed protein product [Candidatus Protochlamydia amoebophila UWE25]